MATQTSGTQGKGTSGQQGMSRGTGTQDVTYNLVSIVYHALQGAETYEQYIQDAEQGGQQQLAQFFRQVQQENKRRAEEGCQLLAQTIGQQGGRPGQMTQSGSSGGQMGGSSHSGSQSSQSNPSSSRSSSQMGGQSSGSQSSQSGASSGRGSQMGQSHGSSHSGQSDANTGRSGRSASDRDDSGSSSR